MEPKGSLPCSQQPVSILSQIKPVPVLPFYFFKIHFNIIVRSWASSVSRFECSYIIMIMIKWLCVHAHYWVIHMQSVTWFLGHPSSSFFQKQHELDLFLSPCARGGVTYWLEVPQTYAWCKPAHRFKWWQWQISVRAQETSSPVGTAMTRLPASSAPQHRTLPQSPRSPHASSAPQHRT